MNRSGFQKPNLPRKTFRYKVYFYGTYETGTLKSEGMWIYNPENKAKFTPKKKKPKGYDEGVDQIENTPEIAPVEVLDHEAVAAAGKAWAVEQPAPKDTDKTMKAGKRKAAEMNAPKVPAKMAAKHLKDSSRDSSSLVSLLTTSTRGILKNCS